MDIVGFVYMVLCKDDSFYVGSHRGYDAMNRVNDHNNGLLKQAYTFTRRPVELVWSAYFYRYDEMVAVERQIKGWSRKKKQALVNEDSAMLKALSARGFRPALDAHPSRRALAGAPQDEDRT